MCVHKGRGDSSKEGGLQGSKPGSEKPMWEPLDALRTRWEVIPPREPSLLKAASRFC